MNTVQLTLTQLSPKQAVDLLSAAQKLGIGSGGVETAQTRETKVAKPAETKSAKGKPATKQAPAASEDDELLEDDDDLGDDEEMSADSDDDELVEDEESTDDDLGDDDEEASEVTKKDVKAAFKKFMSNYKVKGKTDVAAGRKEALKILKSFKYKSVDDIKEKDFSKIIEKLEG